MDKEKALEKIKKCLALSNSSNEHEAAQALKQAQALMKKYELEAHDVALSEIRSIFSEKTVPARTQDWHWQLMHMIREVFGCYSCWNGTKVRFYGMGTRPELASYAFDVVLRQLTAARRRWLKEECREIKQSRRTYLANCYCERWIYGARSKVQLFILSKDEQTLMEEYRKTRLQNVQLHYAMNGAEELKQIGA